MAEFAASRNTVKRTITAKRGTIYDSNNNALALNVSSYTVIAYLPKSTVYTKENYVKDIQATAEALSPVLNMEVDTLISLLSQDRYQVELGPGGRGITELKKDEIKALNLSGIDFIESQKRYYPNGDFASYVIGYAKENEITETDTNGNETTINQITGELGIEAKYNDLLKGTDGYIEYQQDKYGYKIANTQEKEIEAQNGYDIYLTIDEKIQRFIESAIKESQNTYNPEWMTISVMDAKTGDILGTSSTPSFDPNVRNITNYENILTSLPFEPGSTMKTYTYMCAMEKGIYDGNVTFTSGSFQVGEDTINDWNRSGWGTISFDKGYEYSSNVGIANLIDRGLSRQDLYDCFTKYGFGSLTGIELSREQPGKLNFIYPIEVYTAGFGQGITTTPIQHLQALTMIANNGDMLKPHIVSKIVNNNNGETTYERKIEKVSNVISSSTANKMKDLMYITVQGTDAGTTGYPYKIEGFDVIGKTGTSEIYSAQTGGYLTGDNAYIFSYAGMYPYENPQIIIYAAMKLPTWGKSRGLYKAVTDIMKSIAKYKNMFSEQQEENTLKMIEIPSYVSQNTNDVVSNLTSKGIECVVIGNGDKIINQSIVNTSIMTGEKIILLTNSNNYQMPSIIGWSRSDIIALMKLLNIPYEIDGYGYAVNQSIAKGTIITSDLSMNVTLSGTLEG
ncbi:MAG: penicillin-binding protein [Tenericutes bacterium]|nr:penicillin-binding protein [Mycoplasmatota bacterium]